MCRMMPAYHKNHGPVKELKNKLFQLSICFFDIISEAIFLIENCW